MQHSALLQRQLLFTALAIIEILSVLASSGVSVFMAMRGHGYWALVAWSLTLPLASTLAMWFYTGWIPNRPRRGTKVRSMKRFGGTVTLNSVVVYAAYNEALRREIDDLVRSAIDSRDLRAPKATQQDLIEIGSEGTFSRRMR